MKSVLVFLVLGLAISAQARDVRGKLNAPVEVTVVSEQTGNLVKYTASLKYVSINRTSVSLDSGVRAMCGDNLGLLAEDTQLTLTSASGITETVVVKKTEGKRKVSVFGDCPQEGSEIQMQLSLQTEEGPILEEELK